MVVDKKLYNLLGVSPDADETAIKKGYRKQALKFHPDKPTGNEEKFKEISEAFDILSNKDKRELYDKYGLTSARSGQPPMPEFDSSDYSDGGHGGFHNFGSTGMPGGFSGMSGGFGGMPGGAQFSFGGPGGQHAFSTSDAFNIFNNFSHMGDYSDDSEDGFASFMHGAGGGSKRSRGGFGSKMPKQKATKPDPHVVKLAVALEDLYTGTTKKMKIGRKNASGGKEFNVLEVNVKPGWKAGTKITFAGKGDVQPTGVAQDVVFEIEEKRNDNFRREGNDLYQTVKLSLREALTGYTKIIDTIDGKKLKLNQVGPTQPGSTSRYPDRGMPLSKTPSEHGDLVLEFKVEFPTSLTPAQKEAINANFS